MLPIHWTPQALDELDEIVVNVVHARRQFPHAS